MIKRIFLLLFSILLCLTVTFAWIVTKNEVNAKSFMINYEKGTLIISDKNIRASLWMRSNEDEAHMIEISNSDEINKGEKFVVENVVPGTYVYFTIKLQNTTDREIPIDLSISSLSCHESLINDPDAPKVFIYTAGVTYQNYPIAKNPGEKNHTLIQDQMIKIGDDTYTVPLYSGLYVPPTGTDDWVEIEGYFRFSEELDNTFQDKLFRVESFKIVE